MSHPNEAVVRRMYAAINDRDKDALGAQFADDAVWHGGEAQIRGKEAIGGW